MNHQPFENWLLSEEELSPEDVNALDAHLETCDQCRKLGEAWSGVLDLFQEVPEVEPAPSFISRWQERLEIEHKIELAMRHRWQSMIMLILIGNVITGLVFLLATQFFTTFETPLSLFMSGIYRLTSIVTFISAVQNIFFTLYRTITSVVPAGIWAILGIGLVGSGAIWVISMTSLAVLPRRT